MSDIKGKILSIETDDDQETLDLRKKQVPEKPSGILKKLDDNPQSNAKQRKSQAAEASTGIFWIIAWAISFCWLAIVITVTLMSYGFDGIFQTLSPENWLALSALSLLPIAIVFLCAKSLVQMALMQRNIEELTQAADAISRPDERVEERARTLAGAVRSQIINVDSSLKTSMDRLAGMENTLKGHTEALANSHIAATRQTGDIAQRLSEERDGLKSISSSFDERMNALSRMMSEHSERLTQSTHMAEQKIQEARVSVEGAAAKINASSEIVRENALQASTSLSESETSIAGLADKIKTQANSLDGINARHAADMHALVEQMRAEQEQMSASIEERLGKMRDMALSAQVSAESLNDASESGRQTIEALAQSANLADNAVKQRFADMEEMVRYSNSKAESISERAAKRVRDSLSLTRMEIKRIEGDMLALEAHITDKTLEFERDKSPSRSDSLFGWKKSLISFRPVDDDPIAQPLKLETETIIDAPDDQEEAVVVEATPEDAQVEDSPDDNNAGSKDTLALTPADEDSLSLDIEIPELTVPDPDLELKAEAQTLISPIESELRGPSKPRRSWSWRNMLGGISELEEGTQSAAPRASAAFDMSVQSQKIIARLTHIGLSPNAVVDDGCIIEVVNTRKAKGRDAMREVIVLRLSEPVRHLRSHLESNPAIRDEVDLFTAQYANALSAYVYDREALRAQFETESGRAYVLCDAALG